MCPDCSPPRIAALAIQRLEHVAVADVGRDHAHAALLHQPVEAEVRHRRHRDDVDTEMQREDRDDLIAVERLSPFSSTASMRSPSPSNATPRSNDAADDELLQRREIGCTATDVDVGAVRVVADRLDLGAELLEGAGREAGVRAVRAVDRDAQVR